MPIALAAWFHAYLCAQQPSAWTRITDRATDRKLEIALSRGTDGVLHLAHVGQGPKKDLVHVRLGVDGKLAGPPAFIVKGWETISPPVLLTLPDGSLQVLFGGSVSAPRPDVRNKGALYAGLSPDGGRTWQFASGAPPMNSDPSTLSLSAAVDQEATLMTALTREGEVLLQRGTGASMGAMQIREGPCCVHGTRVAADGQSGEIGVSWFQKTKDDPGIYLRTMLPVTGKPVPAPGSADCEPGQQIALTGRSGAPGLYLAYCAGSLNRREVKLWNLKAGSEPVTVTRTAGVRNVAVSPGPEGRLWVMWVTVKCPRQCDPTRRSPGSASLT